MLWLEQFYFDYLAVFRLIHLGFFVNSILYSSLNIYGRLVISSLTRLVFFLSTEKPSLSIYQAAST